MNEFCENPRCQFHLAVKVVPTNTLVYIDRNDDNKEKRINRLHVVQQTPGGAPPKDFFFCENCANVLAMTFGKTSTPKENVTSTEKGN